jgi:hypothetical protein
MKILDIKHSELRTITHFLIEKKILFHPTISPNGILDISGYSGKEITVILDRNILVRFLRLVENGELKDNESLKIVSSLILWGMFNGIAFNAGLALAEYSSFHKENAKANLENNLFQEIFRQYEPQIWLDLAIGKRVSLPKIKLATIKHNNFLVEDGHFKMHYLEMLKLSNLFYDNSKKITEKFGNFFNWVRENILICRYTTIFSAFLLGGKSKLFKKENMEFEEIDKVCKNAAWDLTYLSFWSTLYSKEENEIFLFATLDKELKDLFIATHVRPESIFNEIFGKSIGQEITSMLSEKYLPRKMPKIDIQKLDNLIYKEKKELNNLFKK